MIYYADNGIGMTKRYTMKWRGEYYPKEKKKTYKQETNSRDSTNKHTTNEQRKELFDYVV